ncbi:MAG TPA: magnesium transporter [Terriglobales bacterium]|nr:magnesium transporter [Terriglobales bacterium]
METETVAQELARLITDRNWQAVRATASKLPAPELADILPELEKSHRVLLFRILPRELAADTVAYMESGTRDEFLKNLTDEEARQLLANLSPDDRTELLSELPSQATRRLLNLLSPEDLAEARNLLGYPEQSVGRLMTPDYVSVRPEWTASQATRHIRQYGRDSEIFDQVYVTDRQGKLVGRIYLRKLIFTHPDTPVTTLMESGIQSVSAFDDREVAVRTVEHYDLNVLPVVGSDGVLLGIITVDDVLDVAEKEATEDIQKMGGLEALSGPYLQVSFPSMVRKRGGWLALLFLGEMLTATAMSYYEHEIASAVVLALFIPLIISSGGNSGSQAASLIIRSLALEEVRPRDWFRVFHREVLTGVALGTVLGSIGFVRVVLWQHLGITNYGEHYLLVGFTIWASLIGVVLFGSLAGSMLPFVMRSFGFDPAASSAPFVATLVDVTGLVIYFSIAHFILRGALL